MFSVCGHLSLKPLIMSGYSRRISSWWFACLGGRGEYLSVRMIAASLRYLSCFWCFPFSKKNGESQLCSIFEVNTSPKWITSLSENWRSVESYGPDHTSWIALWLWTRERRSPIGKVSSKDMSTIWFQTQLVSQSSWRHHRADVKKEPGFKCANKRHTVFGNNADSCSLEKITHHLCILDTNKYISPLTKSGSWMLYFH